MTHQCKSCGGFCGKAGCERAKLDSAPRNTHEIEAAILLREQAESINALTLALEVERDAANLYAKQVAHWIGKHDALLEQQLEAQATQPAQPVGINGLTSAETSASMSVMGLSKPKVAQPAHHIEQDLKMVQPAQVPGWLPIESAPKDGSSYLVWAGGVGMAHYVENYASGYPHKAPFSENLASWKSKATHWMPLPAAPSPKEGQP